MSNLPSDSVAPDVPERELEAGSSSDPELEVMSLASPVRSMCTRRTLLEHDYLPIDFNGQK